MFSKRAAPKPVFLLKLDSADNNLHGISHKLARDYTVAILLGREWMVVFTEIVANVKIEAFHFLMPLKSSKSL